MGSSKTIATTSTTSTKRATTRKDARTDVAITHADREVFANGATKGDVADYYRAVAQWLLPEIAQRPLSVLRCPDGTAKACFFQKHAGRGWGEHIREISLRDSSGHADYLYIEDERGLLELVQMNTIELHPWGATVADPEHADRIVFDLDPHASVAWSQVVAAAKSLRGMLASVTLESFVRTSGGKGLHVVVPLQPAAAWDDAKHFAQAVAEVMVEREPAAYVAVAGESKREGRIFIDWLRNYRGSTSVASYSLRARESAGVALPAAWDELGRLGSGDAFTIGNALRKIKARKSDPWMEIGAFRQSLPKKMPTA